MRKRQQQHCSETVLQEDPYTLLREDMEEMSGRFCCLGHLLIGTEIVMSIFHSFDFAFYRLKNLIIVKIISSFIDNNNNCESLSRPNLSVLPCFTHV